uniref:Uncharacterized protein n=1 Tax=Acrobeloides nanus TaxID=290746 RepID=A0A914DX05_9BILA
MPTKSSTISVKNRLRGYLREGMEGRKHKPVDHRIKYCSKKMDPGLVQKLSEDTKKKIDFIRRNGAIEKR